MISNSDLTFLREAETCWRRIKQSRATVKVINHACMDFRNSLGLHLRSNPRLAAYMWAATHRVSLDNISSHASSYSYASRVNFVEKDCSRLIQKELQSVFQHNLETFTEFLEYHRYRSVTAQRLVMLKLSLR